MIEGRSPAVLIYPSKLRSSSRARLADDGLATFFTSLLIAMRAARAYRSFE